MTPDSTHESVSVRVCMCVCARACVHVRVCMCVKIILQSPIHSLVRTMESAWESLIARTLESVAVLLKSLLHKHRNVGRETILPHSPSCLHSLTHSHSLLLSVDFCLVERTGFELLIRPVVVNACELFLLRREGFDAGWHNGNGSSHMHNTPQQGSDSKKAPNSKHCNKQVCIIASQGALSTHASAIPQSTSTTSSTLHATHCAPETVTRESRNEEADVDVAQGSGCCNAYATAATEARA